MKSLPLLMTLVLSLFILGGCATQGKLFAEASLSNPQNALVYVYRDDARDARSGGLIVGSLEFPFLYINKKQITKIKEGGYIVAEVPAGATNLTLNKPILGMPGIDQVSHDFLAASGKSYFFELSYDIQNGSKLSYIKQVEDEERVIYSLKESGFKLLPTK